MTGIIKETIRLKNSEATGFVAPLGPVNLVWVVAPKGLVGCGAFDVRALERFGYPAARVRAIKNSSVENLEDLFSGEISEANREAEHIGIAVGMNGREALNLLS
jgi:uncharacterized protein YunC (DUF1805 family)